MNDYRYILDKGSKKFRCPSCGKRRFVRYVDQQAGEYLPEQYGRCDREFSCGYFQNPYSNGYGHDDSDWRDIPRPEPQPTSYVDPKLFKGSLKGYGSNNFVQYLSSLFDAETLQKLISRYHIGTSKYWKGATVFWQVDENRRVRTGKIMLYGPDGHRKKKDDYSYVNWVHTVGNLKDFNLEQCLFGAHLVEDSDKPIAIVESEKTAVICSGYFPEYTWIAAGAKYNLKPETCKILAGHEVVLFPDLDAYDEWLQKADELAGVCNISVSNYLQTVADPEEKQEGYDLADYLVQFHIDEFRGISNHTPDRDQRSEGKYGSSNSRPYPENWDSVRIDPESPEYLEATRHALNDANESELKELCRKDPTVRKLMNLFDGEVMAASELELT